MILPNETTTFKKKGLSEKVLNMNSINKILLFEYILFSVIATFHWSYAVTTAAIKSYNIALEYDFKLSGLTKDFTYFGKFRDFSDYQWKYFRSNFGILFTFCVIFLFLSQFLKKFNFVSFHKLFYLFTGIGFAIYLEIIILKFCGLNEDIRINIIDRGIVDSTHTFIEDSD